MSAQQVKIHQHLSEAWPRAINPLAHIRSHYLFLEAYACLRSWFAFVCENVPPATFKGQITIWHVHEDNSVMV